MMVIIEEKSNQINKESDRFYDKISLSKSIIF